MLQNRHVKIKIFSADGSSEQAVSKLMYFRYRQIESLSICPALDLCVYLRKRGKRLEFLSVKML